LPSLLIDERNEVMVNDKFQALFGVSGAELNEMLEKSGGGLLPWGGDIMGRLLSKESDLVSFIKIVAINLDSMGPPAIAPCIREIPSVHVFNVTTADGQSVPCLV